MPHLTRLVCDEKSCSPYRLIMVYAILIILFIIVAIFLFSNVIEINRIVFKHRSEVFSTKSENGKMYRKRILIRFMYLILALIGYFFIAVILFYITGEEFTIKY
jgi:hypothetical protein